MLAPPRRHVTKSPVHALEASDHVGVASGGGVGARARAKMAAAAGDPCVRCGAGRVGGRDCEARGRSRAEAGRKLGARCGSSGWAKAG